MKKLRAHRDAQETQLYKRQFDFYSSPLVPGPVPVGPARHCPELIGHTFISQVSGEKTHLKIMVG